MNHNSMPYSMNVLLVSNVYIDTMHVDEITIAETVVLNLMS